MAYVDEYRQATNQGSKTVLVQFRDKLNGRYLHQKEISRAMLAKLYHEQKVTHAINGVPVVDI